MKMPDEIKKGLEACSADECHGYHVGCPYYNFSARCMQDMAADALTYIRELEAKVPRWIDARRALPDSFSGEVLVIVNGKYKSCEFIDAVLLGEFVQSEGWIIGGYEEWEDPQVKWWMPLPEPPKEE